jgi:hypothetical protein
MGGEASRCAPPPASLSRCGNSCGGGTGVSLKTTDDKQTTKLKKGGFRQGGLNFAPLPTPPKRYNLPLRLGGWGGKIPSGAERKGRGCNYHDVDDDEDDDGKGGKQGKNY